MLRLWRDWFEGIDFKNELFDLVLRRPGRDGPELVAPPAPLLVFVLAMELALLELAKFTLAPFEPFETLLTFVFIVFKLPLEGIFFISFVGVVPGGDDKPSFPFISSKTLFGKSLNPGNWTELINW